MDLSAHVNGYQDGASWSTIPYSSAAGNVRLKRLLPPGIPRPGMGHTLPGGEATPVKWVTAGLVTLLATNAASFVPRRYRQTDVPGRDPNVGRARATAHPDGRVRVAPAASR